MSAGHPELAEQTYRRVAALPGSRYKPIHALYLFQSGKGAEAVLEFEKLAKEDPSDRNLRTDLVKAYLSLNRVGDAEKILTAALKKNGLDTDAMLQRSRIYLASGKLAEAETDLHQVLISETIRPKRTIFFQRSGWVVTISPAKRTSWGRSQA